MIWLGYAGFSLLFLLLALHTLRKARANERTLDDLKKSAITLAYRHSPKDSLGLFEGPARLELFGHVTHIGWVRQGPERIDLLTIEGEALQCDARARYRLTPLTWQRFCEICADATERRARLQESSEKWRAAAEERDALHARAEEFQERHGKLKGALEKGIDGLTAAIMAAQRDDRPEADILDIKVQLQEAFNADDPF